MSIKRDEPDEDVKELDQADAIIVAHNRKEMVFELIPQLLAAPVIQNIIVVDNASTDDIHREGPARFPEVKWVCLEKNIGCLAWNMGFAHSVAEYGVILDDDCVPDMASLKKALVKMAHDKTIGLCAFNILNHYTGESEWAQMEHVDNSAGWPSAIGACMIVRTQAFWAVGGYKDYFLCFNDLDLALSMWENGFKVIFNKDWKAYHKKKIHKQKKRRFFYELQNFLWTLFGHFGGIMSIIIAIKFVMGAAIDARKRDEYGEIIRGGIAGFRLGVSQRKHSGGELPHPIKQLFYQNYFRGKRLNFILPKIFS